jgi:ankyrin repeat protein
VARCEKRFKSQEELFEHLKPKMFELESLRSFLGLGQRLGDCLFCSGGSTWSTQAIFEKGIELQKSLTSTGSGLAPCVAEMVAAGDLDVQRVCDCTSCWNRYYGEYGHFPITQTTPLHAAATNGLIHVVEMILQNGGDINLQCSESGTPLHAAARAGQKSIVKLLLDRDAILKSQDYDTALCAAAARGHEEIVRMLLDHGANANAEGEVHFSQCTALQAASEAGHFEVVQVLLDKGANVKAQCGDQGTALHKALACGHLEVARLLLDKCANVDSLDGRRRTPLQIASKRGRLELVRLLLDNGANVNAQGGDYGTALQAAIDSGKRELVQLLLDRGALPLGGDGETERNRDC